LQWEQITGGSWLAVISGTTGLPVATKHNKVNNKK
jgi:hypothetical protein